MKKLLLSLLILNLSFLSFAMPGFNSYIQDNSGEFVYYKDNSFARESYVGLLCYDSNTYQMRYYAPQNDSLPEKTVAVLFTIDPNKDTFDMTGENVIVADYTNSEDVDIVNYMHDLLYEFSSRRRRLGDLTPQTEGYRNYANLKDNGLYTNADYAQFGGDVRIVYDVMIPFFNLKRIEDAKGKAIFECVEIGSISSNEDPLFNKFVKIPDTGKIKINSVKMKTSNTVKATSADQELTLDETWNQTMENMWTQSDDAIITLASINADASNTFVDYSLLRMLLESKDGYYITLDKCDVIFDKGQIRIYSESFIEKNSKVFYGIKYLTENNNKKYDYISFATTKANYLTKRSYYDKILKSYSVSTTQKDQKLLLESGEPIHICWNSPSLPR